MIRPELQPPEFAETAGEIRLVSIQMAQKATWLNVNSKQSSSKQSPQNQKEIALFLIILVSMGWKIGFSFQNRACTAGGGKLVKLHSRRLTRRWRSLVGKNQSNI